MEHKIVLCRYIAADEGLAFVGRRTFANLEAHWETKSSLKFRPNKHLLGQELVCSPAAVPMSTSALGQFRGQ